MDNDRLEDLARRLESNANGLARNGIMGIRPSMLEAAQVIRSLLADNAAKDAELAKVKAERDEWRDNAAEFKRLCEEWQTRADSLEAALAEARRVIAFYAAESDSGHRARTFLQENPNDAG